MRIYCWLLAVMILAVLVLVLLIRKPKLPTEAGYTLSPSSPTFVACDASKRNTAVSLPAANGLHRQFIIEKVDASANVCEITSAHGDLIDGAPGWAIAAQHETLHLVDAHPNNWLRVPPYKTNVIGIHMDVPRPKKKQ